MKRTLRLRGPQGQRVTIVAGILGLVEDEQVVRDAFTSDAPGAVLLGIPYEDLDAVRATLGREEEAEFERAELDDAYLERLSKFAPTRSPPPDLYALFALAEVAKLPVDAIDLGDEPYTESYTQNVGMFEVLRSSRSQRRLPSLLIEAKTPEEFALAWDTALYGTKGLRRVQAAREESMAEKIRALPSSGPSILALLPLPRVAGVVARLEAAGWRAVA